MCENFPPWPAKLEQALRGELPAGWEESIPDFRPTRRGCDPRRLGKVLNAIAPKLPTLIGGSAI